MITIGVVSCGVAACMVDIFAQVHILQSSPKLVLPSQYPILVHDPSEIKCTFWGTFLSTLEMEGFLPHFLTASGAHPRASQFSSMALLPEHRVRADDAATDWIPSPPGGAGTSRLEYRASVLSPAARIKFTSY